MFIAAFNLWAFHAFAECFVWKSVASNCSESAFCKKFAFVGKREYAENSQAARLVKAGVDKCASDTFQFVVVVDGKRTYFGDVFPQDGKARASDYLTIIFIHEKTGNVAIDLIWTFAKHQTFVCVRIDKVKNGLRVGNFCLSNHNNAVRVKVVAKEGFDNDRGIS